MADHPVKVPPELRKEWLAEFYDTPIAVPEVTTGIANRAAQWGADQELEACCEWIGYPVGVRRLRAARRPKPPTLAEQGMESLSAVVDALRLGFPGESMDGFHIQNLAAALNRLRELEAQAND